MGVDPRSGTLAGLESLMAHLRSQQGCPWDRKQTWRSLLPYIVEETYEVVEAVECGSSEALKDELGDVLFHIVFYSRIAQEEGHFTLADVIRGVSEKMIRRHPHVFEPTREKIQDADEVPGVWEEMKREEKRTAGGANRVPASIFDDLNSHLPALLLAGKVQRKMAQVGFDWKDPQDVLAKVEEEVGELRQALAQQDPGAMEEELGDVLFTLVNLARHLRVDAEMALRRSTMKFQGRFRFMEKRLHEQGKTANDTHLEQLEALWQESKTQPPNPKNNPEGP